MVLCRSRRVLPNPGPSSFQASGSPEWRSPTAPQIVSGRSSHNICTPLSCRLATPSPSSGPPLAPTRDRRASLGRLALRRPPSAQAHAASHLPGPDAGGPRVGGHTRPRLSARPRSAAGAGAGGGDAGARLPRGPAQPRPAPPSGPPLRLAALSRRAPPPARLSAGPGAAGCRGLLGREGRGGSRQGGGATPPRGGCFARTPGRATKAPFRRLPGSVVGCATAAPHPCTQQPAPLLLRPSPVPPPLPPPEGSHTPRAGRCRPRGGQRGSPGGRGLRPARAAAGGARRAPGPRPDSCWAAGAAGGRREAGTGLGGGGTLRPRGACVLEGVADRSGGLGPTPPG